jgi:hypothetical protein
MSKREYRLVIVDVELNDKIFEHHFVYENGKVKFLPATNKMAKAVKEHAAMESEFDPKCHKEYCKGYDL